MDLKKTLHKLSYLKWIFLISLVILIFYCFIALPENLITLIGMIIFIAGIWLGLDSLSDIAKMSQTEVNRYNSTNLAKQQFKTILYITILLVLISFLFLSLKFIFPSKNEELFNEFFNLGLNCWALILGLLCLLKSIYEKESFAKSQINNQQTE